MFDCKFNVYIHVLLISRLCYVTSCKILCFQVRDKFTNIFEIVKFVAFGTFLKAIGTWKLPINLFPPGISEIIHEIPTPPIWLHSPSKRPDTGRQSQQPLLIRDIQLERGGLLCALLII